MNLPNLLSTFRILLVPVTVFIYFSGLPGARISAGIVIAVAGLTDMLDGYIARKYNMTTRLGKILDPLADKLTQASALSCLAISRSIPVWILLAYVIKELFMALGGLSMMRKYQNVMSSNKLGKFSSLYIVVSVIVLVMFEGIGFVAATVILGIGMGLAFASLLYYLYLYLKIKAGEREIK